MTKTYTFRKDEKLKSKKIIRDLLESGNTLSSFPLKIYWKTANTEDQTNTKVAVSVSKKAFKKAVDRNLIKRRIREAYRKNKHELYEFLNERQQKTVLIILYIHKKSLSYTVIDQAIKKVLRLLKHKIERAV